MTTKPLKIKDIWIDVIQLAAAEAGLAPDPNEAGSFIGTDKQFEKFEMLLQDYEKYTLDEIYQMTGEIRKETEEAFKYMFDHPIDQI